MRGASQPGVRWCTHSVWNDDDDVDVASTSDVQERFQNVRSRLINRMTGLKQTAERLQDMLDGCQTQLLTTAAHFQPHAPSGRRITGTETQIEYMQLEGSQLQSLLMARSWPRT